TVADIPLTAGKHVLKIAFSAGEFNLGKMTFTRTGDLTNSYPSANAGTDLKVVLPATSATLNGSASYESSGKALAYRWKQIYGPTTAVISDSTATKPIVSGLAEGMYSFRLIVKNTDLRYSTDEVLVMVTSTANVAPTVSLTSPANNSTFTEGKPVTLSANASDFDGTISQVDFYQGTTLISSVTTAPYSATWNPAAGNYAITAKATDNGGGVSTSQAANVTISPLMSCTTTSTTATQGSFAVGYKCTFETVGTDVTITFEMLDDKAGVIAYLWRETPFGESAMANVSGKIFSTTISGQTSGSTISYACKFAYTGGMSVTKYMTYVVGTNCGSTTNDTQAPTGFSATLGAVTANSVELLLNATDNSGNVVYNVSYGSNTASTSTASGTQKSLLITALTAGTPYTFSVTASDLAGNQAGNNPIVISATTAANTNTDCAGTASEASQGTFSVGYKYGFVTTGTDVSISFELLDDKTGLVAYLWNYTSGFAESAMTNGGGKKFTKTLTGQTAGSVIKVACKFAYAGGMVVTKQFSYTVGNACAGTAVETVNSSEPFFYPNPFQNVLHIELPDENSRLMLYDIVGNKVFDGQVPSMYNLDMSGLKTGIYFLKAESSRGIMDGKVVKK
ncbi:MAG TPA: Ig-like domain-containing protein, partial [Paludibacter sp.]